MSSIYLFFTEVLCFYSVVLLFLTRPEFTFALGALPYGRGFIAACPPFFLVL